MVSPDQRIDPNKNINSKTQGQEVRRKPPARDFREVAEQVDERRYSEDEERERLKAGRKKGSPRAKSHLEERETAPPATNIFELAKGRREETDEKSSSRRDDSAVEEVSSGKKSLFEVAAEKQKKMSAYGAIEQPDLAAINPSPLQLHSAFTAAATTKEFAKVSTPASLQQIIDQIARAVYTLEKGGTSETIISLKGAFNGSRLIIAENASAPGEMNITIDNLTLQAQQLLESNKKLLLDELAHKNVVVHIFTASTAVEPTHIDREVAQRQGQSSGNEFGRGDENLGNEQEPPESE